MKLVGDGFVLLVLGQLVVFLFLGLMVLYIEVTAYAVKRFSKAEELEIFPEGITDTVDDSDEDLEVAAAVAAVEKHRS
jgi:sodium pump decarboxylase gamma subunit